MDWHFRSRSHQCNECETAFEDEQPYHTILFRGMESLERRDICPGCWDKNHKAEPGKTDGYISHWQGVYEVPPPPPPEGRSTFLRAHCVFFLRVTLSSLLDSSEASVRADLPAGSSLPSSPVCMLIETLD